MEFKFPYESLLKLKRWKEKERVYRLFVEQSKLTLQQEGLTATKKEVATVFSLIVDQNAEDAHMGKYIRGYMETLKGKEAGEEAMLSKQEEKVEEARTILVEEKKEKEVLNKLKDRYMTDFKAAIEKDERDFLDESGISQHLRKKS